MTIPSGTRVGRYAIRSLLGAGGMGEVYLAEDSELGRVVALKILPAEIAADRGRMQRFVQEARAASSLNHPSILTIHEIGTADEGSRFIATEFIDGMTLRRRMVGGAGMELRAALDIAIQVAAALSAAHEANIVHRDIKPENVMLRPDGLVKVLDFGLAKLTDKESSGDLDTEAATSARLRTDPGTVMGTIAYMSPEQAQGRVVDARTDVWSAGVLLYEMVSGRVPFAGPTWSHIMIAITDREPATLSQHVPGLPEELERIVAKTLAKDLEERYQTAKELAIDLRRLRKRLDLDAEIQRTGPPGDRAIALPSVIPADSAAAALGASSAEYVVSRIKRHGRLISIGSVLMLLAVVALGYALLRGRSVVPSFNTPAPVEAIAVLPFVNSGGNADSEYLSDGMTESLINSLSRLPGLKVKARSSVFRYKGKDVELRQVAAELSVQAILNGRVVQRGDELALYLSLVDARNGDQLWGEQYNRKMTDLVALQSEITFDVSRKLRARLSGADAHELGKNPTENVEAYQLYLKGRYHVYKLTPPEVQRGISYFQQAIEIDPNYALAYVGLSEAYRSFALAGELTPSEFLPKARLAAQRAVDLDDGLGDAHTALGVIKFWYDWDWKGAENEYSRALELNKNSAITHLFYAHLLSNIGRHAEALAAVKRARELDPLSPFVAALEGQFLIHAGRTDEAIVKLKGASEIAPEFHFPHIFTASAYTEKGMYDKAVAEAGRVNELSPKQTVGVSAAGYALAKSGKRDEARAALDSLMQLSRTRFVPPYHIAIVYNGLGETEKVFEWLEKGYELRDPKMTFLKVEPKWRNLRSDPRFKNLLLRVGFAP
ncbi:MAG TPA: protein kinase [Thermoanaerobaculia bacterium]|nr:protein kinase [Thermoanaerobaculia bacterium]